MKAVRSATSLSPMLCSCPRKMASPALHALFEEASLSASKLGASGLGTMKWRRE
jgi:hypothetical protein